MGTSAFGDRKVSVSLGPDGQLVPTDEWRDYHPDYCEERAREARPASQAVDFVVYQHTEQQGGRTRNQITVTAQVRDLESGISVEQRQGEATNMTGVDRADEGWTSDALEEAFAQLQTPMAAPESPCGEVRLEHVAGREVGDDFVFQAGYQGHGQHLGYAWDFGDGAAAEGRSLQRPRHVYSDEGTYPVQVTVYGPDEEVHSQTVQVRVRPSEEANLATCTFRAEVNGAIEGTFEGTATVAFDAEGRSRRGDGPEPGGRRLRPERGPLPVVPPGRETGTLRGTMSVAGHGPDVDEGLIGFFAQQEHYGDFVSVEVQESRVIPYSHLPASLRESMTSFVGVANASEQFEAMMQDPQARAEYEAQVGDVAVRGVVEGQLTQNYGQGLEALQQTPQQITFRGEFDAGGALWGCDPEGALDRMREQWRGASEQIKELMREQGEGGR